MEVIEETRRYPFCVVWTPIPFLSWVIPLIGHVGITTSTGIIRDFSGSFYVAEDDMAFGYPTKYWQLDIRTVNGGPKTWDKAVNLASIEYFNRMCIYFVRSINSGELPKTGIITLVEFLHKSRGFQHNLLSDNCHSHVGMALSLMNYNQSKNWNMIKLALCIFLFGKHVSFIAWLKTWGPFIIFVVLCFGIYAYDKYI